MDHATRDDLDLAQVRVWDGSLTARWHGDAVPQEVARLREAVAVFAEHHGASLPLLQDVKLAVSEALSNAVLHAYANGAPGSIETRASVEPATGTMTISVRDYGTGCRPRADSPGLGVGVPIMASLARTLEVASPADGGTEVRLTFARRTPSHCRPRLTPPRCAAGFRPALE